jgi:small-conductance mechanosensitive channel
MKKPSVRSNKFKAVLTGILLGLLVYLCVTLYMGTLSFLSVAVILLTAVLLTLLILPVIRKGQ